MKRQATIVLTMAYTSLAGQTVAYKVHNAVAGLARVKVFTAKGTADVTNCQNE